MNATMTAPATRSVACEPSEAPVHISDRLAWEVEINSMVCVCFSSTKAKAQWLATKSYWEAYGRRKGEWPRAVASRAPQYDQSALRFEKRQNAWSPDYVLGYPSR